MRTGFSIVGLLLAVAVCALGATPVLAGLDPSPQTTVASISQHGLEYDPVLGDMMTRISESEIYRSTADLQALSTRYYPSPENREAADYLRNRLAAIPGLDVDYQSDRYRNVIATLPGRDGTSEEVVVVGAHYDSISPDPDRAPGATDNGCGAAIVLELARVMSEYQFDRTIQFAFWNAEESDLKGSTDYVADASEDSVEIPLYLNYDSSCYDPANQYVLDVIYNEESRPFADRLTRYNYIYDIGFTLTFNVQNGKSDHVSFWQGGYPAMMTASQSPAPQAHTRNDTIELVSSRYAKKNAQLGMAVLAATAGLRTQKVGLWAMLVSGRSDLPRDPNEQFVNGDGRRDFADVGWVLNRL